MAKNSMTEKKPFNVAEVDKLFAGLLFSSLDELLSYKKEVYDSGLVQHLAQRSASFSQTVSGKTVRGYDYELGDLGEDQGLLTYAMLRKLKPKVLVETGVCNGFSTAFFLLAIKMNKQGHLYSLDLPEIEGGEHDMDEFWRGKRGAVIPSDKQPGWVIPERLKENWSLTLGRSQEVLPLLLKNIGAKVDFFFHDSEHSYECQNFECEQVYPYLNDNGVLMVDDIEMNDAFTDFSRKVNKTHYYVGEGLGFLIK